MKSLMVLPLIEHSSQECLSRKKKTKQKNKTKQKTGLTQAFGSSAVSRVQTRPPFRSLRRRKRISRPASCPRAGREVWVRRQQE